MAIRYELATVDDLAIARDGIAVYATRAALNADLTPEDGELARVTRDGANNGLYVKAGGAGAGSWQPYDYDRVAIVEREVEPLTDAGGASAMRRGLTGVAHGHPFLRSTALAPGASTGGLSPDVVQGMVERAIVDIVLYDANPADTYYLDRVRRNAAGGWFVAIVRASDGQICSQFITSTNPEPSDPELVTRHRLAPLRGVTGDVWVRWADVVAGNNNNGLMMRLAPSAVRPLGGGRGRANLIPSAYEIINRGNQRVIIPDSGASFGFSLDDVTGVFAWDGFTVPDDMHSSGRVRVEAGSVQLTTAHEVAWLDLEQARTHVIAPASVVKVGIYTDTDGGEFRGLPHQLPLAIQRPGNRRFFAPLAAEAARSFGSAPGPDPDPQTYDPSEVVARVVAGDRVDVYVHSFGSGYVLYRLQLVSRSDADVWTIQGVWEATRSGATSFDEGMRLSPESSEWLCAVQEQGKPDFMGGRAHGDETLDSPPVLLLDGKETSLSSSGWHQAHEIVFIQRTSMWEVGSNLTNRRAHRRLWLAFRGGEMHARQRIEWTAAATLSAGYCAMLPLHRYATYTSSSEDTSSPQITGYAANDLEYISEDYTSQQPGSINWRDGIQRWRLWGTHGSGGEMEVLRVTGPLANRGGMQQNSYSYNKAYIGFVAAQTVAPGDIWSADTRWRVSRS